MNPNSVAARPLQQPIAVNGLLLLNKPAGMTSNQALQKVKRLIRASKAGHTGTLDPAATGMLPLCFGEATKVCAYLLDADKIYRVTAKLGQATDTGDTDGKIIGTQPTPVLDHFAWQRVFENFIGDIEQVPPMYSALKKDGKRLYELARKGETIERKARKVRINSIDLLESAGTRLVFRVHCSKGTYVRSLVEDIAETVGSVAHTEKLHRESVGDFRADDMLDMAGAESLAQDDPELLRARLLPPDAALKRWPSCSLSSLDATQFHRGRQVTVGCEDSGFVKVYGSNGKFLGIGESLGNGAIAPRRIFMLPN